MGLCQSLRRALARWNKTENENAKTSNETSPATLIIPGRQENANQGRPRTWRRLRHRRGSTAGRNKFTKNLQYLQIRRTAITGKIGGQFHLRRRRFVVGM